MSRMVNAIWSALLLLALVRVMCAQSTKQMMKMYNGHVER